MTEANPEDINFTTYRVFDSANTFNADLTNKFADGNVSINQSVKHYYGRTHASRQRYEGNSGTANIYYEVFCYGTTGGNTCDTSLIPGTVLKRTDDIRWYINYSHTVNEGSVGAVVEKDNIGYVTATTPSVASPSQTTLTYDANGDGVDNESYPYRTTMENTASRWLIYDPNNPAAFTNSFSVEFDTADSNWSGEHNTTTTTRSVGSVKTNRRSQW
jgi:hypothetical protein